MQKMGKKLYADIILVLVLLIVALSVFVIWRLTRESGEWAVVYIDSEEAGRFPLSVDGEDSLNGGSNILVISEGRAYIKYADCPDGKCIKMGKKSLSGESIICLPNKLSIHIEGGEEVLLGMGAMADRRLGLPGNAGEELL